MTEKDLAQKFVEYFSSYDLYFEVDYAGHQIDIVALEGSITTAIEVKTSFNFKVLEQALMNKPYFNYSYIAVPWFKDSEVQRRLCKDYGIGLIVYNDKWRYNEVEVLVQPKLTRIKSDKLVNRLSDRHKNSKPGTKSGDSEKVTAFQLTVDNLKQQIKRHPEQTIKETIESISHHYRNDLMAKNNIYQWTRKGIITGVEIENGRYILTETEKQI